MSRIGNAIITIPAGVTVDGKDGVITFKGPKGTLTQVYDPIITLTVEGNVVNLIDKQTCDTRNEEGLNGGENQRKDNIEKFSKRPYTV